MSEFAEAALDYAARDWRVFPCAPGEKRPLTQHGLHDATTVTEQLSDWWSRWPDANIGLVTGGAFDVLDVDGDDGLDELSRLVGGDHVELPAGPSVHTPHRGVHLYFHPTGRGNRAGFRPGLDYRGVGGYVVAPPSVHADGGAWRWSYEWGIDTALEAAPGWLLALLERPAARRQPVRRSIPCDVSLYVRAALEGEVRRVAVAAIGNRNDALVRAAFNVGQLVGGGSLDAATAAGCLLGAALRASLPEAEARRTIASGLRAGHEHPRQVA